MVTITALVTLAGLALSPQAASPDERTIPAEFRGEWNARLEDCGAWNDSSLRITASEVLFYESDGRVRGVFLDGPSEIIIVLDMSGEEQTWVASYRFTLASDGSQLSDGLEGGSLRYRCPTR